MCGVVSASVAVSSMLCWFVVPFIVGKCKRVGCYPPCARRLLFCFGSVCAGGCLTFPFARGFLYPLKSVVVVMSDWAMCGLAVGRVVGVCGGRGLWLGHAVLSIACP